MLHKFKSGFSQTETCVNTDVLLLLEIVYAYMYNDTAFKL